MCAYMLNDYLKSTYGRKLYKISIDAGFSCPNRDGTRGYGGCIFCSEGGSGDFAERADWRADNNWADGVIARGKKRVSAKFKPKGDGANYIAYFQAFTNTYAPVETLRQIYEPVISHPDIEVLSIATRPDCLDEDVVELLRELNAKKTVWVELGLQTIHERTAELINRGYRTEEYDDAVMRLKNAGIKVITHVILGLPGESREDMLETVTHVSEMGSWGIKLQLLHILKGTKLAEIYEEKPFPVFTLEEYTEFVRGILKVLPADMVVHRLTGDGSKRLLIEPKWSADKKKVLNALHNFS